MPETPHNSNEGTAVDDVRRVREQIARQHRGDLRAHVEETNRITAEICARLSIKPAAAPAPSPKSAGTGGQ